MKMKPLLWSLVMHWEYEQTYAAPHSMHKKGMWISIQCT